MSDRIGRKPELKGILKVPNGAPVARDAAAAASPHAEDTFTPAPLQAPPKKTVHLAEEPEVRKIPTRKKLSAEDVDLSPIMPAEVDDAILAWERESARRTPELLKAHVEAAKAGANALIVNLRDLTQRPPQSQIDLAALKGRLKQGSKIDKKIKELVADSVTKKEDKTELTRLQKGVNAYAKIAGEQIADYELNQKIS